jgi:O-palmitoleoyl-L-serine hydrolase
MSKLVALSLISAVLAAGKNATLSLFDLNVYPEAKCLDGSPSGYYYREGVGSNANKFVVFFQGGGYCTDPEMCYQRSLTNLGTSTLWPAETCGDIDPGNGFCCSTGGILSADPVLNPATYDYSLIYMGYCSGDSFSANNETFVNNTHLFHKGRPILNAVLDHAAANHQLASASLVVLAGCSAGGVSTYFNADYVSQKIATMSGGNTKVVALADAGYLQDLRSVTGTSKTHDRFVNASMFWNASTNSACQSKNDAVNGRWYCLVSQYVLPYITTPIFVLGAFYDVSIAKDDAVGPSSNCNPVFNPSCSQSDLTKWDLYRNITISHVTNPILSNPKNGVFYSSCCPHCSSVTGGLGSAAHNNTWTKIDINGQSPATAFLAWIEGANSKTLDPGPYSTDVSCLGWH